MKTQATQFPMHPEESSPNDRAKRARQILTAVGNPPNGTSSASQPQLPEGLADWFVAKHTKDEALFRHLLSRHGFTTQDTGLSTKHG